MSHHRAKRRAKRKKEREYFEDMRIVELLKIQLLAISIYLISDMFFYIFGQLFLLAAYRQDSEISIDQVDEFLIAACYYALIASIISSKADFIALNRKGDRISRNNLSYSLEAERIIANSSLFAVGLFYYDLLGVIGIYKRQLFYRNNIVPSDLIEVLTIQFIAYNMRICADCLAYRYNVQSINLINRKYEREDVNDVPNPDVIAIAASKIYLFGRVLLLYVNYKIYLYSIKLEFQYEDRNYIRPNIIRVFANIIGLIGNIMALVGFEKLYSRNIVLPVFGR